MDEGVPREHAPDCSRFAVEVVEVADLERHAWVFAPGTFDESGHQIHALGHHPEFSEEVGPLAGAAAGVDHATFDPARPSRYKLTIRGMHGAHRPEQIGVLRRPPGVRVADLADHTAESKETDAAAR